MVTFNYTVDFDAIENKVSNWIWPEGFNDAFWSDSEGSYFDYYKNMHNNIDSFMEIAKGERAEFREYTSSFLEEKTGLDVSTQAKTMEIDDISIELDEKKML